MIDENQTEFYAALTPKIRLELCFQGTSLRKTAECPDTWVRCGEGSPVECAPETSGCSLGGCPDGQEACNGDCCGQLFKCCNWCIDGLFCEDTCVSILFPFCP